MRVLAATFGAAAALVTATSAIALDGQAGAFVAPQISTLGLGVEAGYRINDYVGVRGSGNFFRLNRSIDVDGIDYSGKATLKSFGATADVFPFGGGFHVSGGLRLNYNDIDLAAAPGGPITIGGTTYTPAQAGSLNGKVDFKRVAPYLGIGWMGSLLSPNLHFGADLGVMFQGSPRVSLQSNSRFVSPADLERERADIADELRPYRFYPVVSVSVGYRF